MTPGQPIARPRGEALLIEASAARQAFVCAYSSSAEYEAEIIAARRAAGAYRPRLHPRSALLIFALVGFALLLLASLAPG
jgi:hypothetical protein